MFKTMGYSPGFLLKIVDFGPVRILTESLRTSPKPLEIHFQACRRRFREFGTISRIYQNPPSSKPWAIAQGFCSKSVDFGPLRILTESLRRSPKPLEIHFQACRRRVREFGMISHTYQNPASSKPWAIAQVFCSKSADFRSVAIQTESLRTSPKTVKTSFASMQGTFEGVWDDFLHLLISALFKSMGYSPLQAFCSKSVDIGPLGIYPES